MQSQAIPQKDIEALSLANAGDYPWKQRYYKVKDRILERYGIPDGYDLQVIEHYCYDCDGLGCPRCDKGVWDRKQWYLLRYKLGGQVFHRPVRILPLEYDKQKDLREGIKGRIRHYFVDQQKAQKAAFYLMRKYDKKLWLEVHKARLGSALYPLKSRIVWAWRRQWSRLTGMFRRDEVPF